MQLSKNFKLEEFTRSGSATKLGIKNEPSAEQIENMKELCKQILQPIRDHWGEPIIVSSGYRCPKLNTAVKGAANSDHKYGAAVDFHTKSDKPSDNKRLFELCEILLKQGTITNVRQLIDEYGYNWIHVSINHKNNSYKNGQVLHLK